MIKLVVVAAVVTLLAACSSMSGDASMARSASMSDTAVMGGPGPVPIGPRDGFGGGRDYEGPP